MAEVQADASASTSVVEQAQEKAQETAEQARGALRQAVSQQVESRASQGSEQLRQLGDAFRASGRQLREAGNDAPAKALEGLAERAEQAAGYLSRSSSDRLLRDAEHLGRRNPWLVVGGGLVVGLAASRLLKASSTRRFEELRQRGYTSRQQYPTWDAYRLQPAPATGGDGPPQP